MNTVRQFVASKLAYVDTTIEGFSALFLSRLSYKSAGIVFLLLIFVFYETIFPKLSFAFSKTDSVVNLASPKQPETQSLFTEKVTIKTQTLRFQKKTMVDALLKPGETKIVQTGTSGEKTVQTKIVFHQDQEFSRESTLVTEKKPVDEVVAIGVDPDEKTLETPYGTIKYKTKLTVWATSYDSNCSGCNQTTSIGLKAGYGVIAVDPRVIPLRSRVYVPGYGIAIAGDTGGSIKGNKIDLGFDSLATGWWTSRFTEVFLLTN